jgi:Uri superfamily endonuclease
MREIYILIITIQKNIAIKVSALGKIDFKKGRYAYVGSAQNNLKKRIQKLLSKNRKKKQHIDYLLMNPYVKVENIHYKKAKKDEECKIAQVFSSVEEPINGFGSSDCKCYSHLFRLRSINYFTKHKFKEINNIEIEGDKITIGKCSK